MDRSFFKRKSKEVAKDLLGNILIKNELKGKIVETEAYFGPKDPASRASNGRTKISKVMWEEPGTILVYVVHSYNLFNIVTGRTGKPGAVLIRALEPLKGIRTMRDRRGFKELHKLCSGPGKLTEAFGIDKTYNKKNILDIGGLKIIRSNEKPEICSSKRIGVSEDLNQDLRFFIKGNEFLSR